MAYIARLRNLHSAVSAPLSGSVTAGSVVPSRGDKWYIDPEEVRQWDAPFHIKFGGAVPPSQGPNWEHFLYMNKNTMYPRMPFYQRQLRSPNIKYDEGVNGRRNCGETYHIMEEWLTPHGQDQHRNNGCDSIPLGLMDLLLCIGGFVLLIKFMKWLDDRLAISLNTPKIYPFENLWVEQGNNPSVPKEQRPYVSWKITHIGADVGLQR